MFRILVVVVLVDISLAMTCLNRKGQFVDWYIVYKLPANHTSRDPLVQQGVAFYYLDADSPNFRLSDVSITSPTNHPLYTTLQQVYSHNTGLKQYAMYNDQPPAEEDPKDEWREYGHTKGIYAFDDKEGFWLISSVPEFPSQRSRGYAFKRKQTLVGQAILCVSVNRKYQAVIENIFNITKPNIYDSKKGTAHAFFRDDRKTNEVIPVTSLRGKTFKYFAKSSEFSKDLYSDLVAPVLRESLYVHTWYPDLNSSCAKYKVMNIEEIKFTKDIQFKSNRDHSKWAVTERGKWACVGDLNRAIKQMKRGGGTMCMPHASVWKEFNDVIKSVSKCQGLPILATNGLNP